MPSNPPTVADLEAEVAGRCAVALAEAGVYLRDLDSGGLPVTLAIRQGLRKGAKCVGLFLSDPLALADGDVARLSPFAAERVLDEAELFALERALLHWHRAVQKHEEHAVAPAPMAGGWLAEEKRNVRERASELKEACSRPYREPADPIVVGHAPAFGCRFPGDTVLPVDPRCYPETYGPWWPGLGPWGGGTR